MFQSEAETAGLVRGQRRAIESAIVNIGHVWHYHHHRQGFFLGNLVQGVFEKNLYLTEPPAKFSAVAI